MRNLASVLKQLPKRRVSRIANKNCCCCSRLLSFAFCIVVVELGLESATCYFEPRDLIFDLKKDRLEGQGADLLGAA